MEHNSINSLPESFLTSLTQLEYVRMAHNQLTDTGIPANTFNVSGLVELDLSFNRLERIPSVSTSLQHLYLQANHIKGKHTPRWRCTSIESRSVLYMSDTWLHVCARICDHCLKHWHVEHFMKGSDPKFPVIHLQRHWLVLMEVVRGCSLTPSPSPLQSSLWAAFAPSPTWPTSPGLRRCDWMATRSASRTSPRSPPSACVWLLPSMFDWRQRRMLLFETHKSQNCVKCGK